MKPEDLIDILRACSYEPYAYSGRSMYGKECVGVNLESIGDLFKLGVALAADGENDRVAALFNLVPSTDSMGHGIVVYFKSVPWPPEPSLAQALSSCDEELDM